MSVDEGAVEMYRNGKWQVKPRHHTRRLLCEQLPGCNGTTDVECVMGGVMQCVRDTRCDHVIHCDAGEDEAGCPGVWEGGGVGGRRSGREEKLVEVRMEGLGGGLRK